MSEQYGYPPVNATFAFSPPNGNPFSSGLFAICDDPVICLGTLFFPCISYGIVADRVHEYGPITPALLHLLFSRVALGPCILGPVTRGELRKKYGLEDTLFRDWMLHVFCHPCALCQEVREIKIQDSLVAVGPTSFQQTIQSPLLPDKAASSGNGTALPSPPEEVPEEAPEQPLLKEVD